MGAIRDLFRRLGGGQRRRQDADIGRRFRSLEEQAERQRQRVEERNGEAEEAYAPSDIDLKDKYHERFKEVHEDLAEFARKFRFSPDIELTKEQVAEHTPIGWVPVNSTCILKTKWEDYGIGNGLGDLWIVFVEGDGTEYQYPGFPEELFLEFITSPSKGIYYNEKIRDQFGGGKGWF